MFPLKGSRTRDMKEKMTSIGGVEAVVGDEVIKESINNWVSICKQ